METEAEAAARADREANQKVNDARAAGTHKEPEHDHEAAREADREANRRANAERLSVRTVAGPVVSRSKATAKKKRAPKPNTAKERRRAKRAKK